MVTVMTIALPDCSAQLATTHCYSLFQHFSVRAQVSLRTSILYSHAGRFRLYQSHRLSQAVGLSMPRPRCRRSHSPTRNLRLSCSWLSRSTPHATANVDAMLQYASIYLVLMVRTARVGLGICTLLNIARSLSHGALTSSKRKREYAPRGVYFGGREVLPVPHSLQSPPRKDPVVDVRNPYSVRPRKTHTTPSRDTSLIILIHPVTGTPVSLSPLRTGFHQRLVMRHGAA